MCGTGMPKMGLPGKSGKQQKVYCCKQWKDSIGNPLLERDNDSFALLKSTGKIVHLDYLCMCCLLLVLGESKGEFPGIWPAVCVGWVQVGSPCGR